jgi:FkbM family methyltransferase
VKNYWKILRNQQRPVRFVVARLLMSTGLCRFLTIQQAGFRLRFHPANLSSQLWINPTARNEALAFFRAYLKPGDRVVDVGANIGDTVLASALQVGKTGHVVGIEAHPRTFSFLQDNLRLNRVANVLAIQSAVGTGSGTIQFSDDRLDDMNRVGGGNLEVPVERLDKLVPDNLPVNFLKVDVEGYEKYVFEGAPNLLKRTECVFFEVSSIHFARFGYTTRDLLELLVNDGFLLFRISGSATLTAISTEFDTAEFENLIALREDTAFRRRTGWTISA